MGTSPSSFLFSFSFSFFLFKHPLPFFQSLIENKILSLPVWSKGKNRYVGLVDVTDFVTFISQHFDQNILLSDDIKQFFSAKDRFTSLLVKNISNISERNPWYPVENDAPLVRLVDTFCRGNIHRLPIVEGGGDLYTMVSQTDMVAYIVAHLDSEFLKKLAETKVEGAVGTWGKGERSLALE
jgi:CBS-domain-containing membrane protein